MTHRAIVGIQSLSGRIGFRIRHQGCVIHLPVDGKNNFLCVTGGLELVRAMQGHMGAVIREKFDALAAARKRKDESVEAGRAYVAAYVTFTHLVEGIHDAFAPAHGHDHGTPAP